ncbi:MAG: phage tail length tape measure family protein, partial [Loktanella sp.]|nr:phage tail length tape measure family protein [Loktanella sp.]
MATEQEIKFLLRMQDETQKALQSAANTMGGLRDKVEQAQGAMDRTDQAMGRQAQTSKKHSAGMRQAGQETKKASDFTDQFHGRMRQATSAVAVMDGPLGGIASRFASLGALVNNAGLELGAYALAIAGVTFAFRQFLTVGTNFETQMLTTQSIIRSTGREASTSAEEINELVVALADQTLGSTAGIRAASNQLLSFRHVGEDVFERVMRAAVDLNAVGFGSIQGGAVAIARALQDPRDGLTRLRRANVEFTDSQEETIASLVEAGKSAQAYDMILSGVEERVGGASLDQAAGAAGSWDTLTEAVTNFVEQFTSASGLLGRVSSLVDAASDAVKTATANIDEIVRATRAATAAMTAFTALKAAPFFIGLAASIGKATVAMLTFNTVMKANPIGLVITAISAVVGALSFFRDETVQVGGEAVRIGDLVSAAWRTVKDVFNDVKDAVTPVFDTLVGAGKDALEGLGSVVALVGRGFRGFANTVVGVWVAIGNGAVNAAVVLKDALVGAISDVLARIKALGTGLAAIFTFDFEGAREAGRTFTDEFDIGMKEDLARLST